MKVINRCFYSIYCSAGCILQQLVTTAAIGNRFSKVTNPYTFLYESENDKGLNKNLSDY